MDPGEPKTDTVADLERLSSRELVERWRAAARQTPATAANVYDEISRRNVARVNNLLLLFTAVVTIATVAALVIAIARG